LFLYNVLLLSRQWHQFVLCIRIEEDPYHANYGTMQAPFSHFIQWTILDVPCQWCCSCCMCSSEQKRKTILLIEKKNKKIIHAYKNKKWVKNLAQSYYLQLPSSLYGLGWLNIDSPMSHLVIYYLLFFGKKFHFLNLFFLEKNEEFFFPYVKWVFSTKYATFQQINVLKKVKILFPIECFPWYQFDNLCFWTNFDNTKRVQNTKKGNQYFSFKKTL
jgi:hypothetical protein